MQKKGWPSVEQNFSHLSIVCDPFNKNKIRCSDPSLSNLLVAVLEMASDHSWAELPQLSGVCCFPRHSCSTSVSLLAEGHVTFCLKRWLSEPAESSHCLPKSSQCVSPDWNLWDGPHLSRPTEPELELQESPPLSRKEFESPTHPESDRRVHNITMSCETCREFHVLRQLGHGCIDLFFCSVKPPLSARVWRSFCNPFPTQCHQRWQEGFEDESSPPISIVRVFLALFSKEWACFQGDQPSGLCLTTSQVGLLILTMDQVQLWAIDTYQCIPLLLAICKHVCLKSSPILKFSNHITSDLHVGRQKPLR